MNTFAEYEGRQAYHAGLHLFDCPYDGNSDAAIEWKHGFISEEDHASDETNTGE